MTRPCVDRRHAATAG